MSFFNTAAETPTDVEHSLGPTTGFGAAARAAFADAHDNWSQFGLQAQFAEVEQQQLDKLYQTTGERLPAMIGYPVFKAMAKQFEGEPLTAADNEALKQVGDRFARIAEIKKTHPEVMDYTQMWDAVKQQAQATDLREQKASALSGFAGSAGSLLGGMAGSMTSRDPLNIATLALSGVGKTAFMRMGTEAAGNGLVEAIDQFTGVQENRKLLGLDNSFEQAAGQVGMAALGAGVLRGAGEGLGAGARALARRAAAKAAPAIRAATVAGEMEDVIGPSPFGRSRVAQGVHLGELDRVSKAIDAAPLGTEPVSRGSFLDSVMDRSGRTLAALASRDSDAMFAASPDPADFSKLLDDTPGLVGFGKYSVDEGARGKIADVNTKLADLNTAIQVADVKADGLKLRMGQLEPDVLPPAATSPLVKQLAETNQQLAAVAEDKTMKAKARKAATAKLTRVKSALETALSKSTRSRAELNALKGDQAKHLQTGDDLRLKRAQLVRSTENATPQAQHGGIDRRTMIAELLGKAPPPETPLVLSRISRPATAEFANEAKAALDAIDKRETPTPRVLPKAEGAAPDAPDKVDIGADAGPIEVTTRIVIGKDADGNAVTATIAEVLEDLKDDDDLIANMKACLLQ